MKLILLLTSTIGVQNKQFYELNIKAPKDIIELDGFISRNIELW